VFAGVGIYNALKEHRGRVTVKIDGKAVSAASLIAMAGDEILMSPGSIMMIHNPWTWTQGEAKDMRHAADVLDQVKEAILNIYQTRVKSKTRDEISRMMDNEEWMSARKAVAEGFADGILHSEEREGISAAYSISRLAIQNSASAAMQRFFEQWQQMQQSKEPGNPAHNQPEENPAISRIFDIQRRVSVREKSFRRYGAR
jgi:ATP-dependent Clp protease protease subunit